MATDRIQDNYRIQVENILVDFSTNPRNDYGSPEIWEEFKNSIRTEGQKMPITVKSIGNGQYKLTHGFRRMKAITELISEGVDITVVRAMVTKATDEQILLDHITLNTGKPLTEVEVSEIFIKLKKYGYTNSEIATKAGYKYQKVLSLLAFQENTSKLVKDAVTNGEMSITAALEISGSLDIQEQNEKIDEVRNSFDFQKTGKIKVKAVKQPKELTMSDDILYTTIIALEETFPQVEFSKKETEMKEFYKRLNDYGFKIVKI